MSFADAEWHKLYKIHLFKPLLGATLYPLAFGKSLCVFGSMPLFYQTFVKIECRECHNLQLEKCATQTVDGCYSYNSVVGYITRSLLYV